MLQYSAGRTASRRAALVTASLRTVQPHIAIRWQSSAPATIVDRGFWRSLVPKPFRKENREQLKSLTKTKDWNPATFFIIIFLLIGSMSIQMIALRNSFERYIRSSEVKINQLREVVGKIQNGEDVDVEQILGTGNPEKEADWEEILRSIENADAAPKQPKKKSRRSKSEQETHQVAKNEEQQETPQTETTQATAKPASSFGNFF